MKNRWGYSYGKVVSVRLPATVYATLEAKARGKGLRLGVYIKEVLCRGAEKVSGVPVDSVNGSKPLSEPVGSVDGNYRTWKPGIKCKAGEKVWYKGELVIAPEIDADGNTF